MRVVKLLAILGVASCRAAAEGCDLSSYCSKNDTHDHLRNGQSQSGIVQPASKRAGGVFTIADLKSQGSTPSRISSMILPRSAAMPTISSFEWTASTVYTTRVITVISCAPTISDCPADSTAIVTSTAAVSTTQLPVTSISSKPNQPTGSRSWPVSPLHSQATQSYSTRETSTPALSPLPGLPTDASTVQGISQWTTSTFYTTRIVTVISCAATVTDCPAHSTSLLTSTMAISSTIYTVTTTTLSTSRTTNLSPSRSLSSLPSTSTNPFTPSESPSLSTSSRWSASTVYTTRFFTVTSCPPTVTDCPAESTQVITSTFLSSLTSTTTNVVTDATTKTMTQTVPAESSLFSSTGSMPGSLSSETTQITTNVPPQSLTTTLPTSFHTAGVSSAVTATDLSSASLGPPTSTTIISIIPSSIIKPSTGMPPIELTSPSAAFQSTLKQSSLPISSQDLPKSTVTLVAHTTTTLCSVTTTVTASPVVVALSSQGVGHSDTESNSRSTAGGHSATGEHSRKPLQSSVTTHLSGDSISSPISPLTTITDTPSSDNFEVATYCILSWLWLVPECRSVDNITCFCIQSKSTEEVVSCVAAEMSMRAMTKVPMESTRQAASDAFTALCAQQLSQFPEHQNLVLSTDTPSTDTPSTDTPSTDTPSTDTPSTDTPSTDTPSTDTTISESRSLALLPSVTSTVSAVHITSILPSEQISSAGSLNRSRAGPSSLAHNPVGSSSSVQSTIYIQSTSATYGSHRISSASTQTALANSATMERVKLFLLPGGLTVTFLMMV